MSDLSPWSRKLIASAEGADDPTAEAKRRVRDAVLRSVAMAEPPASPHADPGANAPQVLRGIRHGLAAKVVLPVVVSLGLGAAWLASEHAKQPEGAPTVSTAPMAAQPSAPPNVPAPPVGEAASASPMASEAAAPLLASASRAASAVAPPPPPRDGAPARSGARAHAPPTASASSGGSLQEEVRLIREAQAALGRGDARAALRSLDEHARRFPSGMLAIERSGLRAVALCQEGAPDAATSARAFVAAHEGTPIAARVRTACKLAP